MDSATQAAVRGRAADRCEYCQRRQEDSPLVSLQIEHIIPRKHGGGDELENLALACMECNLHKGSDLTGIDPDTKLVILLFHPRKDSWDDHFAWDELAVVGLSPIGRTTVRLLQLNSAVRLRVRRATRHV